MTKDRKCAENKEHIPDGGYGWMIVIGAALTHMLVVGTARSLGLIYEELRDKYHGSASETAWVAAIFNTSRSLIAPVCAMMCKKLSCRTVAMLGGLVIGCGFFISAFANSLYYFYITFAITGFGGAMSFTPAYIMVGNYFDKRKGKAMSLATLGSGLGSIILAPTITGLIHTYTLFGTLIIIGGVQFHNIIAGALYRPLKSPTTKKIEIVAIEKGEKTDYQLQVKKEPEIHNDSYTELRQDDESTSNLQKFVKQETLFTGSGKPKEINDKDVEITYNEKLASSKSTKKFCNFSYDSLLKNRTFYMYGYLIMSMQVCIQSFLIFLPGYVMEKGVSDTGASLVLSVFGFADMGGRFIFGFLFDLKWILTRRRDFYCLVSALFGLTAMSLTFIPNLIGVCVMTAIVAVFEGATHSQRATVLSDFVSQKQMPSAVGVIIFCQGLGNIWGPPFAGYLRDISGTNAYGFIFCGSVMLSAAVLFFFENWMCHKGPKKDIKE